MGRDEMRAGDADRQAVAEQLRVALAEGRLDLHEYDERLQRTYAAKTYGDLGGLLSDLPAAAVPAPRSPAGEALVTASDAELTRRWLAEVWGSWIPVVGITSAIWAISSLAGGELLYFWPVWVAVPWGLLLVLTTVAGLTNGEPRRRAEKRARKQRARSRKRERRAAARGELPSAEPGPAKPKKAKKTG